MATVEILVLLTVAVVAASCGYLAAVKRAGRTRLPFAAGFFCGLAMSAIVRRRGRARALRTTVAVLRSRRRLRLRLIPVKA